MRTFSRAGSVSSTSVSPSGKGCTRQIFSPVDSFTSVGISPAPVISISAGASAFPALSTWHTKDLLPSPSGIFMGRVNPAFLALNTASCRVMPYQ